MKKNATLVWRGRRLYCNNVEVARIGEVITYQEGKVLSRSYRQNGRHHNTEAAARRAINKRFGIKETQ